MKFFERFSDRFRFCFLKSVYQSPQKCEFSKVLMKKLIFERIFSFQAKKLWLVLLKLLLTRPEDHFCRKKRFRGNKKDILTMDIERMFYGCSQNCFLFFQEKILSNSFSTWWSWNKFLRVHKIILTGRNVFSKIHKYSFFLTVKEQYTVAVNSLFRNPIKRYRQRR